VPAHVNSGGELRLLMTTDAVGGVWTYALDLARGLAAHGVMTTLALLGPTPTLDQAERAASIPGLTLRPTGLPLDWLAKDAAEVTRTGAAIAAMARQLDADLVHLNGPALAAAGSFAMPVVGVCHSCVATWWDAVRTGPLPADFAWRTDLLRRGYAACSALTAPSRAFAEATALAYALPRTPTVVNNGRDPLRLPNRGSSNASVGFAFTAGRLWDAGKNLATLDRAAAELALPVVAAGPTDGPDGSRITLPHIRTLGRLDEVALARWLGHAPLYVSPALYEPFGLAVLEGAQAGCPLILSDIPSFRELWDGAAIFVPAEDDAAVAAAITRVAGNPAGCARLSALARERARRYTVEAMTAAMLDVYLPLVGSATRPKVKVTSA
jgi:glycosyltransferase involved in cell wall biosynthesis